MRKRNAAADPDAATDRFEQLFRRHHSTVVAYVRRRAPAEAVDDVVGETFLVAWRRLGRVPVQELPWLLGVARNVLATHRRGAIRRRALALRLGSVAASTTSASEIPGGVDGVDDRLLAALAKLSAKDREALTLIAWDGLEPHEAAVVMGESSGTFRVRLHRARRRLSRLLEERAQPSHPTSEPRLRMEENHS
jgi:RNA polymerase sigma factor (sigma-70 family)